jgi:hypothetical protein
MANNTGMSDWFAQYMTDGPTINRAEQEQAAGQQAPQNYWIQNQQSGYNDVVSPGYNESQAQQKLIDDNFFANSGVINGLKDESTGAANRDLTSLNNIQGRINQQGAADSRYEAQSRDLANQLGTSRDTANAGTWDNYNTLHSGLGSINSGIDNTLSGVPMTSNIQANMLTSQAAGAQADASSIAAQNQALSFLQGAAGGSLDYQSQGAQAYADPNSIANQQGAADALSAIAGGSNDVHLGNLAGIVGLEQAMSGKYDVQVGQADPAAYAAALDAMGKYKSLTTPQVTDAERFLYEQARQAQEQDERGNRAATLTNLRQRGMLGSGAEIGQSALASQQISQNRLLSDLGANANAVNRSMQALAGYADTSGNLNAQANAIATGNQDRRYDANKTVTGLDANLQTNNMNRRTSAAGMYSDATARLREDSFDESYKRGVAADNASANNQSTRLQGGIASGNLASEQRRQSFDESYKRGAAADQTAQFNEGNRIDTLKYNQDYGLNRANLDLRGAEQKSTNLTTDYTARNNAIGDTYGRDRDVYGANDAVNTRQHADANAQTDRGIGLETTRIGSNDAAVQRSLAIGSARVPNNNQRTAGQVAIQEQRQGDKVSQRNSDRVLGTGAYGVDDDQETGSVGNYRPIYPVQVL